LARDQAELGRECPAIAKGGGVAHLRNEGGRHNMRMCRGQHFEFVIELFEFLI